MEPRLPRDLPGRPGSLLPYETLVGAMMEPAFYAHKPDRVTHVETHISDLFFAGELVYKVKKPVQFSFLDYSTPDKREYFLHEELRLNRRLAPTVYLGVLPISYDSDGWMLGGDGQPLESVLLMRRLPAQRMLPFLLERNQATPEMMDGVAEVLAPFHAQAPRGEKIAAFGQPQAVRKLWEENLKDLRAFAERYLAGDALQNYRDFGANFMARHAVRFERRAREGKVREVHGDLHCEHICFAPEGIQIFDCIDFNLALRCCDVASETAFLVMDLEFRGATALGRRFLKHYVELEGDHEVPLLLPFYKCHRALVRAKVAALSGDGARAAAYLHYASRVTWEARKPFLVVVSGLTGSGKSTLAHVLAERLGFTVISSDVTRKSLAKRVSAGPSAYGETIYSTSMTEKTYASMIDAARKLIEQGEGVILDATFQRRAHRQSIYALAGQHRVPMAWIHCAPGEEIVRERLQRRAEEGRDISDGNWDVYLKQKDAFEPIEEIPSDSCLVLNTNAPSEKLAHSVEEFLRRVVPE